jgi:hypothetical protein
MFIEFDYFKVLSDLGIKEKLLDSIKKNPHNKLTDQQLEKMYQDKVLYHGERMNQYVDKYFKDYLNLSSQGKSKDEIDSQLNKMVEEYLQKNQQVK